MTNNDSGYREVLKDNESLRAFLRAMGQFDQRFCEVMNEGTDFTLKLEVRGCNGNLLHARLQCDEFERPRSAEVEQLRGEKGRS